MYKSPIEVIVSQVQEMIIQQQEDQTFAAVQKVGIKVDKDELVKALAYDRGQYEKGYTDGIVAFAERLYEELRIYGQKDRFDKSVFLNVVDHLLKELVGDNNG